MIKNLSKILLSIICVSIAASIAANAQVDESLRIKLESVLYKFKNYRYSTISLYEVKDIKDFRNAVKSFDQEQTEQNQNADQECLKKASEELKTIVKAQLEAGGTKTQIQRELVNRGYDVPDDIECIIKALDVGTANRPVIKKAYVVTTRKPISQVEPSSIIALIVSYDDNEAIEKNIGMSAAKNVYTNPELFSTTLNPADFRAANMYELVINAFRQNNIIDKTIEAQGFDGGKSFIQPKYGNTKSLIAKEADINSRDIQSFIRISDAQPSDYTNLHHEVIVSPDLLSWKKYDVPTITYSDGFTDTLSFKTNDNLPTLGFELRYGNEEINYPSMWSERLTASAMWENVKLGVILPTDGWASLTKDMYKIDRKLSYAGVGVNASADFAIKVIPQSGIFHFNLGYVFGDAEEPGFKKRNTDPEVYEYVKGDDDHLIRFNGTLHYTFGVSIDEDYQMRFGIGATGYAAETWRYKTVTDQDNNKKLEYYKSDDEFVGGISGRVEFMAKNTITPYGATVQYFDEAVFANLWLQIPVVKNFMSLRLDAKGYFNVIKNEPRAWENESVFMPMARLIFTF